VRIQMLETADGASDGIHVRRYEKGQVYTVSESLADNFIRQQGIAIPFEEKAMPAAPENKAKGPAPENKAKPRPKRKRKKK